MTNFTKLLSLLILFLLPFTAYSYEFSCERTSDSWTGFKNKTAMEGVYTKEISLNANDFASKMGSTSVFSSEAYGDLKVNLTLLKNGKLTAVFPKYAGRVAPGKYRCSSDASEVIEFLETGANPPSNISSSNDYQAVWHCGATLNDAFWTLNKQGELTKDEDKSGVEVYGLVGDNKIKLIRVEGDEDITEETFSAMTSMIDQMEWIKRGNTFFGNGFIKAGEKVIAVNFMLNDEQIFGSGLVLGMPDMVASIGMDYCQRIY